MFSRARPLGLANSCVAYMTQLVYCTTLFLEHLNIAMKADILPVFHNRLGMCMTEYKDALVSNQHRFNTELITYRQITAYILC